MAANIELQRGDVISLVTGEYSDKSLLGIFVCLVNFDLSSQAQIFAEEHKENLYPSFDHYEFPTWLVAKQFLLPVEYTTIHTGSYGEYDPEICNG